MQDPASYALSDKVRLILQGPAGSGKSDLACNFPKPYFIDIDVNLGGVIRRRTKSKLPLPIGFDFLDKNDKGEPITMPNRFKRLDELLLAAQSNDAVETIILDSGTTLVDVMMAEVLRQQSKSEFTKREWGFFAILAKKMLGTLAAMRKHIVLICHEKTEKDEKGAVVYPTKIAWPGQVGENLGAYFTNVWRCENKQVPKLPGPGVDYKFLVRTMPDYKYSLKNTLGLPAEFEFDWKLIDNALKGV